MCLIVGSRFANDNMNDYRKVYEEFWKPIIEASGEPSFDQIMRELSDYKFLMDQASKVYYHVTGGLLSKTNYHAHTVTDVADEHTQKFIDEALEDQKEAES